MGEDGFLKESDTLSGFCFFKESLAEPQAPNTVTRLRAKRTNSGIPLLVDIFESGERSLHDLCHIVKDAKVP